MIRDILRFPLTRRNGAAALPALATAVLVAAMTVTTPGRLQAQSPASAHGGIPARLAMTIEEKDKTKTGALPAPKAQLMAGGVRARLNLSGAGARFAAGSAVFAEITLTNEKSARPVGAELLLSTENAEIRDVSGKRVKATDAANNTVAAAITGLRKGEPRTLTVELLLLAVDSADPGPGEAHNRLKITLRRPGADSDASDSTVVTWPVADCAGDFYAQITAIREQNAERIGPALKAAWRRDRRRPGRWLFRPATSGSRAIRKCVRWRRVWDYRRGRYRSRCSRYRTVRPAAPKGIEITKQERKLFRFAAPLVRSRAIDRQLASRQHFGWLAQKVANDVRRYLRQDKHPAICTGAVEFASYYTERMADVEKRAALFADRFEQARKAAVARTTEAREAVKADPGGHPGWGAMPLSILQARESRTLQDLIADLAALGGGDAPVEEIEQADDTFAALKIARSYVSKDGLKPLAPAARSAVHHALSLIEAADYIGTVSGHYSAIDTLITGSLRAVRAAHGEHCSCGG
jgi:hypothetical protein